jgi:hypothetical protein
MGRYQVVQIRADGISVVRHDNIRRLNGALQVQQDLVQDTRDWMKKRAIGDEKVVEGPTGVEGEVASVLLLADKDFVIVTKIVQK